MHPTRNKECNPPSSEGSSPSSSDNFIHQRHYELSGSTTHVSPPRRSPIGKPYDLAVEHGAHPVLARHKRGQGEPYQEPNRYVPGSITHKGHAEDGRGREHDEEGAAIAWTQEVANCTHCKPRENASRHRSNPGVSNVAFGEVEVVADDGDKRGCCEGGDKAGEEGDPRKVEGSHVGIG